MRNEETRKDDERLASLSLSLPSIAELTRGRGKGNHVDEIIPSFHLPNPSISLHTSLDFQEILHGEEKGIIDSERRDRPGRSELERKERDEPRDDSPFHSLLFFPSYGLFIMFLFHILAVHSLPKTSEARRDRGGKEGQMKDREMIKLQNAESR